MENEFREKDTDYVANIASLMIYAFIVRFSLERSKSMEHFIDHQFFDAHPKLLL